jgi:hypothetical protein
MSGALRLGLKPGRRTVEITSTQSWQCPPGVFSVDAEIVNGGDGAEGGNPGLPGLVLASGTTGTLAYVNFGTPASAMRGGAGGKHGARIVVQRIPVVPGNSYSIVIGAAGVGGAGAVAQAAVNIGDSTYNAGTLPLPGAATAGGTSSAFGYSPTPNGQYAPTRAAGGSTGTTTFNSSGGVYNGGYPIGTGASERGTAWGGTTATFAPDPAIPDSGASGGCGGISPAPQSSKGTSGGGAGLGGQAAGRGTGGIPGTSGASGSLNASAAQGGNGANGTAGADGDHYGAGGHGGGGGGMGGSTWGTSGGATLGGKGGNGGNGGSGRQGVVRITYSSAT